MAATSIFNGSLAVGASSGPLIYSPTAPFAGIEVTLKTTINGKDSGAIPEVLISYQLSQDGGATFSDPILLGLEDSFSTGASETIVSLPNVNDSFSTVKFVLKNQDTQNVITNVTLLANTYDAGGGTGASQGGSSSVTVTNVVSTTLDGSSPTGVSPDTGGSGTVGLFGTMVKRLSSILSTLQAGIASTVSGTVAVSNFPTSSSSLGSTSAPNVSTFKDGTSSNLAAVASDGSVKVDASGHTLPVSGTFYQANQPITVDGTAATGVAQDTGAAGAQGWLSSIVKNLRTLVTGITVSNFPTSQTVAGSVSVSNFPATQPVSGTVTTDGTNATGVSQDTGGAGTQGWLSSIVKNLRLLVTGITVSNFPASQTVAGSVSVSNFPGTQPISGTVTTDGAGATGVAQDTGASGTQGWLSSILKNLRSLVTGITVSNFPATQPISGNVGITGNVTVGNFPATQPVSNTNDGGPPTSVITDTGGSGTLGFLGTLTTNIRAIVTNLTAGVIAKMNYTYTAAQTAAAGTFTGVAGYNGTTVDPLLTINGGQLRSTIYDALGNTITSQSPTSSSNRALHVEAYGQIYDTIAATWRNLLSAAIGTNSTSGTFGALITQGSIVGTPLPVFDGGIKTTIVAAAAGNLIKSGAGLPCRIIVTATGTAATLFYDNATAGGAATGNIIAVIPANATVGSEYHGVPATVGISVPATTNGSGFSIGWY